MSNKIQSIRGVKDILPGEIEKWQWVERVAHKIFGRYGFKEIRIPIFEFTHLFARGIGETTDIVEKEMYTFDDRSGDRITLRPEGTASVVRSFIEHKMFNPPGMIQLYYIGPMFRYERPQAGRFRQFHQIGVEAMGSSRPEVDAEVISMVMEFLRFLGLQNIELQVNNLGCSKCRPGYREILKNSIRGHLDKLCKNCQQRFERNPLRILDCKVEIDREIAQGLPKTVDHVCERCHSDFDEVQALLKATGIEFVINLNLVRGLDYYNRTAFEIVSSNLGAQNAICGGGRYDNLVEEFGGPKTPCFGFALGLERLISIINFEAIDELQLKPNLFLICLGPKARKESFKLTHQIRTSGISVERAFEEGSLKSQMRKANKSACRFVLIIGENEIKAGKYSLKNMEDGSQQDLPADLLVSKLKKLLRKI